MKFAIKIFAAALAPASTLVALAGECAQFDRTSCPKNGLVQLKE